MRYFLHIGYNGAQYHGWQNQPNVVSVQEVLESKLSKMLKQRIICHGCGRTDAKVHASQYFLHFDFEQIVDSDFVFTINKLLPDDIAVFEIIPVNPGANAQLDALKRTYDYFIHFSKDPFLSNFSTLYLLKNLDFEKMKKAVTLLTKYKDYHSFCLTPNVYKTTLCKISCAKLFLNEEKTRMRFQITSNRFLKGMIRTLVGRLLEIGRGKLSLEKFENALNNNEPLHFNKIAYPQGLYLSKVEYPYLNIPTKSTFSGMLNQQLKTIGKPYQNENILRFL